MKGMPLRPPSLPSPIRWGLVCLGGAWLSAAAHAAPPDPADPMTEVRRGVEDIERRIDAVALKARELEQVVGPAGGRLSESDAIERFQDAVFHYLIGEYQPAAEAFVVLVSTRAMDGGGCPRA